MTSASIEAPAIRVGDVFVKSWTLFFSRVGLFTLLALAAFAPDLALSLLIPKTSGFAPAINIVVMVCTALADAAIIYGVLQALRGRDFTFAESMNMDFGRLGPIVGLSFVVGILIFLGVILLVIPGLIVMTIFAVAVPVCIAERLGVAGSMRRSASLTKGNRWRIFGVLALVGLATVIPLTIIAVAAAFVGSETFGDIASYLTQAFVGAFNAVVAGVLYYQLRAVKEGVDIDKIAEVFD